ncbi:hypothetical protein BpHYR1_030539 [Brachionus plicatilis]|uniref:Uncharacterized protein n=1 Tax=Brachionus plicatilis TaxID=10195 RepID=A0A3M7RZN6_BRAPC|nr:hypothetical protein BpHYR1_030539 [Brachionus plicatilis]
MFSKSQFLSNRLKFLLIYCPFLEWYILNAVSNTMKLKNINRFYMNLKASLSRNSAQKTIEFDQRNSSLFYIPSIGFDRPIKWLIKFDFSKIKKFNCLCDFNFINVRTEFLSQRD